MEQQRYCNVSGGARRPTPIWQPAPALSTLWHLIHSVAPGSSPRHPNSLPRYQECQGQACGGEASRAVTLGCRWPLTARHQRSSSEGAKTQPTQNEHTQFLGDAGHRHLFSPASLPAVASVGRTEHDNVGNSCVPCRHEASMR